MKQDTISNFYWNELEVRLQKIKTVQEPPMLIAAGDHIIGEMDNDLRRLFTVMIEMTDDYEVKTNRLDKLFQALPKANKHDSLEWVRSLFADVSPEVQAQAREVDRLATEVNLLESEHNTVKTNFYHELRRRHPELIGKQNIGVRKGWKVCWTEMPSNQTMTVVLVGGGQEAPKPQGIDRH